MSSSQLEQGAWAPGAAASSAEMPRKTLWQMIRGLFLPQRGQRTLPTLAGYFLIFICLGVGVAAYNTASNILFITVSFLLASLILNGVLSWLNFSRIQWLIHPQAPYRVGTPAGVRLEVSNHKRFIVTFSLWFDMRIRATKIQGRLPLGRQLKPQSSVSLDWSFTPEKRGRERVEVKTIGSQFPFGYLKKVIPGRVHTDIVVWPSRIEYAFKDISGQKVLDRGHALKRKGDGEDLLGVRRYEVGDSRKHIHWKASARRGKLMVRELAEERQDGYILVIDTADEGWKDSHKLEILCRFALSLAEDLFTRNQLTATVINRGNVRWIRSIADLERFFDDLAVVEPVSVGVEPGFADRRNTITFEPVHPGFVNALVGKQQVGQA